MPIECPREIQPLTRVEFEAVDYRVMGHAYACQNELGRLCEESAYQRDLHARLMADGFRDVSIEVPVSVSHQDFAKTYSLDLVVGNALYELKAVAAFNSEHQAQLLNYLFLLDLPRGKLLNFRPPKVQGRIHASSLALEDRGGFRVDSGRWERLSGECCTLRDAMCELLADWGAFLSMKLYEQALVHLCGGESQIVQRMRLSRLGVPLGTQRFNMHSPNVAFRVTAESKQISNMEIHLRRLLAVTELDAIQWINLDHADIAFVTLKK
jgi:GxxExxY protein